MKQTSEGIPLIETKRLLLTLPDMDAAPRLLDFALENDEHLARWSSPHPEHYFTEVYWSEHLREAREEYAAGSAVRFVLLQKQAPEKAVVGFCSFSQIFRGPFQACYLGYQLDHRFVGENLMFEALTAAITFMFDEQKLHRIMANYMPVNERSGKLLRRLGFTVEGYARDYLFIANAWQDHILTSLTNDKL
ncbi:MAG: GNAT family N-acetyltransferase [Pyrinomonadaceae bacterium]